MTDLSSWMNGHAPPQRYKNGHEYRVRWSDSRLRLLFQNSAYRAALIDERTWLRAQEAQARRAVGKGPRADRQHFDFVLAGILRCICGMSISGMRGGRPNRPFRYYACRTRGGGHAKMRLHRADAIEARFIKLLESLAVQPIRVLSDDERADYEHLTTRSAHLRTVLDEVDRGRERVWELDLRGHLDPGAIQTRLATLDTRRGIVERHLVAAIEALTLLEATRERDTEAEELRRTALATFLAGDYTQKTVVARAVVASLGGVRVTTTGRIIVGSKYDRPWRRKKHKREI